MEESKKKIKVLVASNQYGLEPICETGFKDMFYKFGESGDFEIVFFGPWRMAIDQGRNNAVKMALMYECDYLFVYDDDMFFADPMTGIKLLKRVIENDNINVLQALAFIRGYPYKPMVFHLVDLDGKKAMLPYATPEELLAIADENGLVKCDAVGCCATVIRMEVFKHLTEPWFVTGSRNTEDIFFCVKLAHNIKEAGIYCDLTVEAGHLLDRPILTKFSREVLTEMHEKYSIDQLWLPDATFTQRQNNTAKMFDFEKRVNFLENIDKLPIRGQKNEGEN